MAGLAACLCLSTPFEHKGAPNTLFNHRPADNDALAWNPWEPRRLFLRQISPQRHRNEGGSLAARVQFPHLFVNSSASLFWRRSSESEKVRLNKTVTRKLRVICSGSESYLIAMTKLLMKWKARLGFHGGKPVRAQADLTSSSSSSSRLFLGPLHHSWGSPRPVREKRFTS